MKRLIDTFYWISGFNKKRFYEVNVQGKNFKKLFDVTAINWFNNMATISGTESWNKLSVQHKINKLRKIPAIAKVESMIDYDALYEQVKSFFIQQATNVLILLERLNKESFIELQNLQRFEYYADKGKAKCSTNSVKNLKAVWYHGINEDHGIFLNDPIKLKHVIALILYSNCSDLCTAFRETYRRQDQTEKQSAQNNRHKMYGQMGKLLYESFVFFASTKSEVQTLYHGMSVELLFPTMYCAFDAPTSTTTASSVAMTFCNGQGILVKFESSNSSKHIRTLDMSLFSCYDTEEEHLIFETRLRIISIFVPAEKGLYIRDKSMWPLLLYDALVHGIIIHKKVLLKKKNQTALLKMLQNIMKNKPPTKSQYYNSLLMALTTEKKKIWLNKQEIDRLVPSLKEMFIGKDNDFGAYIKYLKSKSDLVICPIFRTKWVMSGPTFDLIARVSESNNKTMCCRNGNNDNIVLVGEVVKCKLSSTKQIIFRPQFTKIEGIFDVKMMLVDVFDDKPIKVHFNLEFECRELENYYTSLHPREMHVKNYNSFDVTLPSIDTLIEQITTASLEMTIMLHNFEDFNIEMDDFDVLNCTVMSQNMEQSRMHKLSDWLSMFYGVSNGAISILDSLSDFTFILFLWYYTETQQFDNEYHFQQETKIAHFLFTLSIGNLISIAMVIAFYICYNIQVESWLQRILYFGLFIILSPVLPAFEYVWGRLKNDNKISESIEVSLQNDGVLIWFKKELFRNKIFLIECVFESCFQIIIQFMAIFALKGLVYKNIYLYSSISIALFVIISKFILLSYNLMRIKLCFNVLCYSMDVLFALIISVFMGTILFDTAISFTGYYFLFEYLIFVLFGCYHISQSFSVPYLAIPILCVFCYPMTIFSFSGFSMYPLFNHLLTGPMEIGKREKFYKKVYKYCCESQNQLEFNQKLIIANYVCIRSYFTQIDKSDEQYYQFCKWLHHQNPFHLTHITIKEFKRRSNNTIYRKIFSKITSMQQLTMFSPASLMLSKCAQLLIRSIAIIPLIVLDTFYLKLFNIDSQFMKNYGNVISVIGIVAVILFLVWCCFIIFESYVDKWNFFCSNMITSTHKQFILISSVEEFIDKCQGIFNNAETRPKDITNEEQVIDDDSEYSLPHYDVTNKLDKFIDEHIGLDFLNLCGFICNILIAIAIIIIIHTVQKTNADNACFVISNASTIYYTISLSIAIIISVASIVIQWCGGKYYQIIQIVKAILFAIFLSGIAIQVYTFYFRNDTHCQYHISSIMIIFFLFIGSEFFFSLMSLTIVILSIAIGVVIGIGLIVLVIALVILPVYGCFKIIQLFGDSGPSVEVDDKTKNANTEIGMSMKNAERLNNQAKKILLLGAGSSGKSTLFKSLKIITKDQNMEMETTEARHVIRQNCVAAILTLLKKSQELYDENPEQNGCCLVNMDDEIVSAIQLVVKYVSE
eukprot:89132_1